MPYTLKINEQFEKTDDFNTFIKSLPNATAFKIEEEYLTNDQINKILNSLVKLEYYYFSKCAINGTPCQDYHSKKTNMTIKSLSTINLDLNRFIARALDVICNTENSRFNQGISKEGPDTFRKNERSRSRKATVLSF